MVLWNFDLVWKNYGTMKKTHYGTIPRTMQPRFTKKQIRSRLPKKFLKKFIALELQFIMENYATMEKSMVLYRKLG